MEQDFQLEEGTVEAQSTDDMTDDDIAASLGFMTTLSEQMMNPGQEDDLQEADPATDPMAMQEEKKKIEGDTDGTPAKDEAQDREIAEIRMQLEQLLAEENDTGTKETED